MVIFYQEECVLLSHSFPYSSTHKVRFILDLIISVQLNCAHLFHEIFQPLQLSTGISDSIVLHISRTITHYCATKKILMKWNKHQLYTNVDRYLLFLIHVTQQQELKVEWQYRKSPWPSGPMKQDNEFSSFYLA